MGTLLGDLCKHMIVFSWNSSQNEKCFETEAVWKMFRDNMEKYGRARQAADVSI